MIILSKDGVIQLDDNGNWNKVEYRLTINGQEHVVTGTTKRGNIILGPKKETIQHMNLVLTPPPQAIDWPALRQQVYRYMYYKKDGSLTTGKDRNVLADRLSKQLQVSNTCAWAWSKKDAGKPHPRNLNLLAEFDFQANSL